MRALPASVLLAFFLGCAATAPAPAPPPPINANEALTAELLAMRTADQDVRKRWLAAQKDPAVVAEMNAVDRKHVARLREIIATHGWPGISLVGKQAAGAAWMIAQHGGQEFLAETLPLMEQAVKQHELDESLYATSLDRALTQQGKKQVYGTQFDTDPATGKCEPMPIEDAEHVDERRIRAGLGPLADYKAQLCALYLQKQK